ncbi:MAG TPA: hypothetical protein VFG66_09245 [Gemmatimonadales bacterium]|nr:hypothetical protein [Gemmatimonadales bacterium]
MKGALRRCAPAVLLVLGAGCGKQAPAAPAGPRLETRWTGGDTAGFAAPAVGEWCDTLDLLEIRAAAGDTGIALAIYPGDSVQPGDYPIRPPDVADTASPSAAMALRWVAQTAVRGFRSDSGTLTLHRAADGALSGSFTIHAHAVSDAVRLMVTGSFEDVHPRPVTRGCTPRVASPDSAAGVD